MGAPDLKQRVATALENGSLAGALGRFNEAYVASRARAYEGIDFEALRDELVGLKGRAAGRLDELAEQFEEQATAAGAQVFRTSDPDEVKRYLARLCKDKGVRRIAKSKSMATEEIHLNAFLEKEGIREDVTLICSGGMRTAMDVAKAICLGADGVVIGTAEMVALGCVRCACCESGRGCPRGIASTDPELMMLMSLDWATQRLINLLNAWREQMVEILVKLGIPSTKALRGRSDVLYYAKEAR